jgi:hypothetical protein
LNASHHEVVVAFAQAGLELHKTLCEMLDEHPTHRTERRGCGYTQATRFLSTYINRPRAAEDAFDLGIFDEWPKNRTESLARQAITAGWPQGWRNLDRADPELRGRLVPSSLVETLAALPARLVGIEAGMQREESRLLLQLIRGIVEPATPGGPDIPAMPEKPEIGSCSQAEEFFLEIAHGRIRRGGRVNIFVDDHDRPLLVEKMGLGESHSAMAVAPVSVCGVTLPPGALFALAYSEHTPRSRALACGHAIALDAIEQARFLRLTTLAVPPEVRQSAFSAQFDAQIRSDMLSPRTTTIEDLRGFATARLSGG